jgi:hypothetical protein
MYNSSPASPTSNLSPTASRLADFSANGLLDSSSGILQRALELSKKQQSLAKPVTTLRYVEQADIIVPQVDVNSATGSDVSHRPATLRCGELVPFSPEELVETKDTEFAFGRRIHIYRGQLRPGSELRDGKGVFLYADGEVFIGDFRANKRNGYGVFLVPTGYGFEGHFKDDKPNGAGRELFPDGSSLIGTFADGLPTGLCVLSTPRNGSIFVGMYSDAGERHGPGTILYDNGDVVQGVWQHGRREGVFKTYYSDRQRLYATQWRADTADTNSRYIGEGDSARPQLPDLSAFPLLPAPDLRAVGIVPDLVTDVHPLLVLMLREGFEALDVEVSGTIELAALREQWITDAASANSRRGMAASLRAYREADTTEFLSKLELVTKNGINVDFAEVLCVCFPHLPATEVKRWASSDLTPEALLRLRGAIGGVATKALDTWQGLSSLTTAAAAAHHHLLLQQQQNSQTPQNQQQQQVPGDRISLMQMYCASNMPTLGGAIRLTRCLFLRSACSSMKTAPRGVTEHQITMAPANAPRHHLKNNHYHHQSAGRQSQQGMSDGISNNNNSPATAVSAGGQPGAASNSAFSSFTSRHGAAPPFHIYTPAQLTSLRISFSDLLAQVFPLTTADERFRVIEMDTVPEPILQHYALFFDAVDVENLQHLSIEHLKAAQQKYRGIASAGGGTGGDPRSGSALRSVLVQERLKSFPLAEHFARKQREKEIALGSRQNGYESRLQPHPQLPWNARWVLLDISLTVSSAKLIDKQRTGFVSLAEILRFSFPSVPCAWTRDRLSGKVTATGTNNDNQADGSPSGASNCRCSICRFCSVRYTKSRPPNPYLEGNAIW